MITMSHVGSSSVKTVHRDGRVDGGGGCVRAGSLWELSAQFCCESKTAVQHKVYYFLRGFVLQRVLGSSPRWALGYAGLLLSKFLLASSHCHSVLRTCLSSPPLAHPLAQLRCLVHGEVFLKASCSGHSFAPEAKCALEQPL